MEYRGYEVEVRELHNGWSARAHKDGILVHGWALSEPTPQQVLDKIKRWIDDWVAIDTGPFPEIARPIEEALRLSQSGWPRHDWTLDDLAEFLAAEAARVRELLDDLNEWASEELERLEREDDAPPEEDFDPEEDYQTRL